MTHQPEFWRKRGKRKWHLCVASPRHNYLSTEPDLYTMVALCDLEFQRDDFAWETRNIKMPPNPGSVCASCKSAAKGETSSQILRRR